jgi:hypothetical protein
VFGKRRIDDQASAAAAWRKIVMTITELRFPPFLQGSRELSAHEERPRGRLKAMQPDRPACQGCERSRQRLNDTLP